MLRLVLVTVEPPAVVVTYTVDVLAGWTVVATLIDTVVTVLAGSVETRVVVAVTDWVDG
jgi:hypothetical protein